MFISTKNTFKSYPQFNLKVIDRQQLYELYPYIDLVIIWLYVYNVIFMLSNNCCYKVHGYIVIRRYSLF